MTSQAAPKLFREPAKTDALNCLGCGAPIQLHGFGHTQRVICQHCGSVLEAGHEPGQSTTLQLLQRVQRERRANILPLHIRGALDGTQWEIIGIAWRETRSDGVAYPWQEILLFNPYEGFRWLIFNMVDNSWSLGMNLDAAPAPTEAPQARPSMRLRGVTYRHFSTADAHVTYVEGEFPWQVRVGDHAEVNDYIAPPLALSIEYSKAEGGSEINVGTQRHIDGAEVWAAFGQPGRPPIPRGISSLQPNPHDASARFYWLSCVAFLVVWLLTSVFYLGGRENKEIFATTTLVPGELVSETIEVGTVGQQTTLAFQLHAPHLDNGWASTQVLLVDADNEHARQFVLDAQNWHGYSQGESYSENDNPVDATIGGIEGGRYLLQIASQSDPKMTRGPKNLSLSVTEDVPLHRYLLFPLLVIFVFPIVNVFRTRAFETQRWMNSDHSGL